MRGRVDVRSKEEKPHGIHVLDEFAGANTQWLLCLCGRLSPQNALRFGTALGPEQDNNLRRRVTCSLLEMLHGDPQ
jgi:hypothetical protein